MTTEKSSKKHNLADIVLCAYKQNDKIEHAYELWSTNGYSTYWPYIARLLGHGQSMVDHS